MSPRVTDEYSEFRRRQIVTAAWECFADKGYAETKIRDIAGKLKLSTGIVYCYFKGKADILDAVHDCGQANTRDLLEKATRERSVRGAVQKIIRAVGLQVPVDLGRRNARAALGLWAEAVKRPSYRRIYLKQYALAEKMLSRIFSEGIKRGELRKEVDPDALAACLLALISGLQVQLVLNDSRDSARFQRTFVDAILGNIWRRGRIERSRI